MPAGRMRIVLLLALIAFAFSVPFLTQTDYLILIGIMVYLRAALAVAVFPLIRMGLLFVAQGGFLAIGAYTSALLVTRAGVNSWLAMPIAGLVCAVVAILTGYPTLRVKGLYFMLVTFGLNQVITIGISNWDWVGGPSGILNIPGPDAIPLPGDMEFKFASMTNSYYLILVLSLVVIFAFYRLWTGQLGQIIRAVNTSEDLARSLGMNTVRYKVAVVAICAFATGILGSYSAHFYGLVSPGQFGVFTSFNPIVFGIVGGIGSFAGPILGTAFLTILPEALRFTLVYETLIYAATLIAVMLFFPTGIFGILARLAGLGASVIRRMTAGGQDRDLLSGRESESSVAAE